MLVCLCVFFFWVYATTQSALLVQQERTHVCSVIRKPRNAWLIRTALSQWTLDLEPIMFVGIIVCACSRHALGFGMLLFRSVVTWKGNFVTISWGASQNYRVTIWHVREDGTWFFERATAWLFHVGAIQKSCVTISGVKEDGIWFVCFGFWFLKLLLWHTASTPITSGPPDRIQVVRSNKVVHGLPDSRPNRTGLPQWTLETWMLCWSDVFVCW